jgi:hypothetical protein
LTTEQLPEGPPQGRLQQIQLARRSDGRKPVTPRALLLRSELQQVLMQIIRATTRLQVIPVTARLKIIRTTAPLVDGFLTVRIRAQAGRSNQGGQQKPPS